MISGIYTITNLITNMIYVGRSINMEKRWRKHRKYMCCTSYVRGNRPLWKACSSIDDFVFDVIEYLPPHLLAKREQYWIDRFLSVGRVLYNSNMHADWPPKPSEEMKERLRVVALNRMKDPTLRARISIKLRGSHHTKAARAKISASQRRKVRNIDTGEVFESLQAAAKWCGRKSNAISKAVNEQTLCAGYLWAFLGRENEALARRSKIKSCRERSIVNKSTGEVFPSIVAAASVLGVSPVAVGLSISRGGRCQGFTFSYQ